MTSDNKEYVLRERDDEEIKRLGFQHEVWKDSSDFAIKNSNVSQSKQIIDLGCGPGYLANDILNKTPDEAIVHCIDNSSKFLDFIKSQNNPALQTIETDIRRGLSSHFNKGSIDSVFCRWVLIFNSQPQKIVKDVYSLLKKGGQFISLEYFDFNEINIYPPSRIFDLIYKGVVKLLSENGGNASIGSQIPQMMKKVGFKKIETFPIYNKGKSGSPFWNWLEMTNENHSNLLEPGYISQQDLDAYYKEWEERSTLPDAFISAPPLMITIGTK